MKRFFIFLAAALAFSGVAAQEKSLKQLQQEFVDLKFGMFIHFNIPTFMHQDWADPDASPEIFNPVKLDCQQWAKAARSANMSYGCLTTKHHSGFCIWDTQTTDYNVMNSPFGRDVVSQYADAFRKEGLKVMLYYSILDTHHDIRPGHIKPREHTEMIKAQLTELLTGYGEITALVIDGWDAPWSRISYDEIPFEEIYHHVKKLQPGCLVMDLNAAKYPAEALFYTDIKSYEQAAGQHIEKDSNVLPALSCLPINKNWFWKEFFPEESVKDPGALVTDNLIPFNEVYCNFILNVAPNRDGLIDKNALEALKKIGKLWKNDGVSCLLGDYDAPLVSENIVKSKPARASWAYDIWISDFANDDNFKTSWRSEESVSEPWIEFDLQGVEPFNAFMFYDTHGRITRYRLLYEQDGQWITFFDGSKEGKAKIHRFNTLWGDKVRIEIKEFSGQPWIAEVGLYNERR